MTSPVDESQAIFSIFIFCSLFSLSWKNSRFSLLSSSILLFHIIFFLCYFHHLHQITPHPSLHSRHPLLFPFSLFSLCWPPQKKAAPDIFPFVSLLRRAKRRRQYIHVSLHPLPSAIRRQKEGERGRKAVGDVFSKKKQKEIPTRNMKRDKKRARGSCISIKRESSRKVFFCFHEGDTYRLVFGSMAESFSARISLSLRLLHFHLIFFPSFYDPPGFTLTHIDEASDWILFSLLLLLSSARRERGMKKKWKMKITQSRKAFYRLAERVFSSRGKEEKKRK